MEMNIPCVRRAQLVEVEQQLGQLSNQGADRPRFLTLAAAWGRLAATPCVMPCGGSLCTEGAQPCK